MYSLIETFNVNQNQLAFLSFSSADLIDKKNQLKLISPWNKNTLMRLVCFISLLVITFIAIARSLENYGTW